MVADEEMYLDTSVCQFRNLAEQPCVAFGDDVLVFVPVVEDVAEQVDGGCLLFDFIKEVDEPSLVCPAVLQRTRAEVGIGEEIDFLPYFVHKAECLMFT